MIVISIVGLGVAILSALEGRIETLAAFCGWFGDGCRATADFYLLGVPVWIWGIAYYGVLIGAIFFFQPAVFWLVMVGLGVEFDPAGADLVVEITEKDAPIPMLRRPDGSITNW